MQHRAVSPETKAGQKIIGWKNAISTMDGYEQFALFLSGEFSTENILFVTEYVQLKQKMRMSIPRLKEKIDTELNLEYTLNLPSEIPQSVIVKGFDVLNDCSDSNLDKAVYDVLKKIFDKYIDSSTAVMEVNISSATKYIYLLQTECINKHCNEKCLIYENCNTK